jgi:hypothetical protein
VRWDRLFEDLEAQLERAADEEFAAELADRTRHELARVRLVDRLGRVVGEAVDLAVEGVGPVTGTLRRVGLDWLLLEPSAGSEVVVANRAVVSVRGLTRAAREPDLWGEVESRLGLGHILRAVARDRSTVTVVSRDGSSCAGTIDRVGADFLEVAEHPPGAVRRSGEVVTMRAVTLGGLAVVRH